MSLDDVVKLGLERGFFFPSAEIYAGAPAGFWEYGHLGTLLKRKFVDAWHRLLVRRDEMILVDGSLILPKPVFVASGHLSTFADPVTRCLSCKSVFRIDRLIEEKLGLKVPERTPPEEIDSIIASRGFKCPVCGGTFDKVSLFNMMFKVLVGAAGEEAYLRPETCQNIFVDFLRIYKISRRRLPLALAQVGKSFRNEISPRQSLIRLREFTQAEVEVFFNPEKANDFNKASAVKGQKLNMWMDDTVKPITSDEAVASGLVSSWLVAYYLWLMQDFYLRLGIPAERIRFRKLGDDERAFYAAEAWDLEVLTSTGWVELVACNNRTDYDLSGHAKVSGVDLKIVEDDVGFIPHVFELSMGVDRSVLALLEMGYKVENERTVLKLHPSLAPITVAVFPLVDRQELTAVARKIYEELSLDFDAFYDESGSIGRRYRRQDEIGTPFCVTVDYKTLEDQTVTVRDRDSMKQERVRITDLKEYINGRLSF
ncbi:MAG: glycine--tRNA ligase [Candidatus Caldarchaeum sp.]|nr:glycine--tRNA ligase [Candidatus Caldarchaeum sp.]